ncbi:MAG: exodeoxyribonuclease VII small subunit [Myxococcota bacterium]
MTSAAKRDSQPTFEAALKQLEDSVTRLEEGEMPLEEALELFEAGVKLSRQCQSTLERAERRIEILVDERDSAAAAAGKAADPKRIAFDADDCVDESATEAEFED